MMDADIYLLSSLKPAILNIFILPFSACKLHRLLEILLSSQEWKCVLNVSCLLLADITTARLVLHLPGPSVSGAEALDTVAGPALSLVEAGGTTILALSPRGRWTLRQFAQCLRMSSYAGDAGMFSIGRHVFSWAPFKILLEWPMLKSWWPPLEVQFRSSADIRLLVSQLFFYLAMWLGR